MKSNPSELIARFELFFFFLLLAIVPHGDMKAGQSDLFSGRLCSVLPATWGGSSHPRRRMPSGSFRKLLSNRSSSGGELMRTGRRKTHGDQMEPQIVLKGKRALQKKNPTENLISVQSLVTLSGPFSLRGNDGRNGTSA